MNVAGQFQKAYESGVAGKLINIVVTKDEVSMALLKGKCLDTFSVFLPLNQLRWPQLPPEFIDEINRVAKDFGGRVWYPDSPDVARHVTGTVAGDELKALVNYLAMGWVICDSMDLADKLSSNGRYSIKAVTLGGDVFDPSGQISGGYHDPSKGNLLSKWAEYKQIRGNYTADIGVMRKKLEDLHRDKDALMQDAEQAERLKQRLDKLDGNGGMDKFTMDLKPKAQSAEERLQEIEAQIEANKSDSENDKKEISKVEKEMKELEAVLKQLKSGDQSQVQKTLKARVEVAKAEQQKMVTEKKSYMQKECELAAEINRLTTELLKNKEDTDKLKDYLKKASVSNQERKMAIQAKKTRLTEQEDELEKAQKQYDEILGLQKLVQQKLTHKEKEVNEAKSQLDKVHSEETSLKSEIDKARAALGERLASGANSMLASAESFSQDQELDALDAKKLARDLAQKKEEYLRLEPAVRREAESERGRLAEQMADLFQKKDTVNENKVQIESNLKQMDFKSEDSLYDCFQFVNKNLGKIFNLLLPGAMASMELIQTPGEQGRKKITGVQMKIGFNGQWKQSMTELSGGQRSLLALSFLLAMLQYKPAPFYILDEIDSAMDLSHTENIGYILSNFFPQSQFIVISLKGGLFNQANVLFRTALIDGRSVVSRFEQKKNRQKATMMVTEEGNDQAGEQAATQNRRIVPEGKENAPPQHNRVNRIVPENEEGHDSRLAPKQPPGRGKRR